MKLTTVTPEDNDIRLDRWFQRHYPSVTQGELQKALRNKLIKVDGKRAESSQRVLAGQVIKHPEFAQEATPKKHSISPQDREWLRSMVLYEDAQIIVLNKPSGLATQGGSGLGDDHLDALLPALADKNGKAPKLVHRLDKDTSGVLLLARDAKTADILMKMFAAKETQKTYWALVAGVPSPAQGKIDAPLVKQGRLGEERMQVVNLTPQELQRAQRSKATREAGGMGAFPHSKEETEAKRAITEYRVIESLGRGMSWVELKPLTGRTHQLRAHMEYLGHPIYGDGKYFGRGDEFPQDLNLPWQLHLHARHLCLPDFNGRTLEFTAPLPAHMRESWDALGLLTKGL